MKKIVLALVLALALSGSLAACKSGLFGPVPAGNDKPDGNGGEGAAGDAGSTP